MEIVQPGILAIYVYIRKLGQFGAFSSLSAIGVKGERFSLPVYLQIRWSNNTISPHRWGGENNSRLPDFLFFSPFPNSLAFRLSPPQKQQPRGESASGKIIGEKNLKKKRLSPDQPSSVSKDPRQNTHSKNNNIRIFILAPPARFPYVSSFSFHSWLFRLRWTDRRFGH